MRDKSVKACLIFVENSLTELKIAYIKAIEDKNITPDLLIKVKNIMENLRSSLDYMAHDVRDNCLSKVHKSQGDVYFPYGKKVEDFVSRLQNNLPDLKKTHPDIYSLIEGIQPYKCGDGWLYDFCKILNDNKHDDLTPQTKSSYKTYTVGFKGESPIITAMAGNVSGSITIDEFPIVFDKEGIPQKIAGSKYQVLVTKWVSIVFRDTSIEVYPFLMKAFLKINDLSEEIYNLLLKENYPPSVRPELVEGSGDMDKKLT